MRAWPWVVAGVGCALVLGGCASGGSPSGKAAQPTLYATIEELTPGPDASRPMSRGVIDHVLHELPCARVDGPHAKVWQGANGWVAYCPFGEGARYARVVSASSSLILNEEITVWRVGRTSVRAVLRPQWAVVCNCSPAEFRQVSAIR